MKIKFFATYREITGTSVIEIKAPENVLGLLKLLSERYSGFRGKLLSSDVRELGSDVIVMVNGRHVTHLQGVKTPLLESDVVAVFPVVAGG